MKAYDLSMKHGISDQEALAFISASSEGSLVVNAGVDEHCPHSNFGIVTDGDGYYNG